MKTMHTIRRIVDRRRGLTLVELLIVIAVLSLLASITYAAIEAVRTSARQKKTEATIAKIDRVIMDKYLSYQTRRIQLNVDAATASTAKVNEIALMRLSLLRDLMRREMPDRWSDVLPDSRASSNPYMVQTALRPAFAKRMEIVYNSNKNVGTKYATAELLYQIVAAVPEAVGQFRDDEIGDLDGDQMREFHDAWGNPIFYLRWPAGFCQIYQGDSDLQTGNVPTSDPRFRPDPFDPMKVGGGYAVFPLIYSAGPDGFTDINAGTDGSGNVAQVTVSDKKLNPFAKDVGGYYVGQPKPSDGLRGEPTDNTLHHWDNIHNHRTSAQ